MKLALLTIGTASFVYGCVLVYQNKCVGVLLVGVGMWAMAESFTKK